MCLGAVITCLCCIEKLDLKTLVAAGSFWPLLFMDTLQRCMLWVNAWQGRPVVHEQTSVVVTYNSIYSTRIPQVLLSFVRVKKEN